MRRSPSSCRGRGFRIDGKGLFALRRGPVFGGQLGPEEKGEQEGGRMAAAF